MKKIIISWVFVLSPHECSGFEFLLLNYTVASLMTRGVRWMSDVAACCEIPGSACRARSRLRYRAVASVYWLKNQALSEQSRWEPHGTKTNTTEDEIFFFFSLSAPLERSILLQFSTDTQLTIRCALSLFVTVSHPLCCPPSDLILPIQSAGKAR